MAKGWTEKEGVDDMMKAYETFGDATKEKALKVVIRCDCS